MDDIKDIQRTDSVSKFLDQQSLRTNPFGENRAADRAYRRAERIASGAYMLTSHIPANEPVRAQVRNSASKLLSGCLALKDQMRSHQSEPVSQILSEIRYMVSLMRLMGISGFVSQANALVVIEALDELGNFIHASQKSMLSENVSLSKDDLIDVRMNTYKPVQKIKDTSNKIATESVSIQNSVSDTTKKVPELSGTSSTRVQSILEILKVGGSLGIRDIAANLPEYSEKMIQRELLDLVSRGSVKKIGLKRWSKYSLVS